MPREPAGCATKCGGGADAKQVNTIRVHASALNSLDFKHCLGIDIADAKTELCFG